MRMDAEVMAGNTGGDDGRDDFAHFRRLAAAIGVAQHHPAGAGLVSGCGTGQRIIRIGLVAIEEMLAIDQRLAAGGKHCLDAVLDRLEVFLIGTAERHAHMVIPAFGHKTDGIAFGLQQGGEPRIIGRRDAGALGHAEGDEFGIAGTLLVEEGRVRRVGAGITALDIIDAELVEQRGNGNLVLDGKIHTGCLLPVAQCGVEESDLFACHVRASPGRSVSCCAPHPATATFSPLAGRRELPHRFHILNTVGDARSLSPQAGRGLG
jgi:hypothetical protein